MEKDIVYYHRLMQKNILLVEEDEKNEKALQAVTDNFLQVFEYIKIFLISKKERYYGYFLMSFVLDIAYTANYPAAVSIDVVPFKMIINPLLLGKETIKEMIYTVCHEIEHIVLDHPAEAQRINQAKDPQKSVDLNIAMDASINDRLNLDIKDLNLKIMKMPKDCVTSKSLKEDFGVNAAPLQDYAYYYRMISGRRPGQKTGKGVIIMKVGGGIVTAKNRVKGIYINDWSGLDDPEDISSVIRKEVQKIVDGIPDENRGLLPSHQQEALKKLLAKPVIRWEQILKKYIGMVPDGYRKTRTRINRRQPERYDISGTIRNRTIKLVVAIDTSASMGKSVLEKVFTEIFSIIQRNKFTLTIIECDAEVQKVYTAKKIQDVDMNVKGRGGTCYTPVIEYINDKREFRDAVLIFFTDGMGDHKIPKPLTYRTLWVLTNRNARLSVEEPYGEIIKMDHGEEMDQGVSVSDFLPT